MDDYVEVKPVKESKGKVNLVTKIVISSDGVPEAHISYDIITPIREGKWSFNEVADKFEQEEKRLKVTTALAFRALTEKWDPQTFMRELDQPLEQIEEKWLKKL
jgi:hypothetical protein